MGDSDPSDYCGPPSYTLEHWTSANAAWSSDFSTCPLVSKVTDQSWSVYTNDLSLVDTVFKVRMVATLLTFSHTVETVITLIDPCLSPNDAVSAPVAGLTL